MRFGQSFLYRHIAITPDKLSVHKSFKPVTGESLKVGVLVVHIIYICGFPRRRRVRAMGVVVGGPVWVPDPSMTDEGGDLERLGPLPMVLVSRRTQFGWFFLTHPGPTLCPYSFAFLFDSIVKVPRRSHTKVIYRHRGRSCYFRVQTGTDPSPHSLFIPGAKCGKKDTLTPFRERERPGVWEEDVLLPQV